MKTKTTTLDARWPKGSAVEIVMVLRTCKVCGLTKPLDHFKVAGNQWGNAGTLHVCAYCRAPWRVRQ